LNVPHKSKSTQGAEVLLEQWRSFSVEGYEASSEGRIRSLDRWRPFLTRWGSIAQRFHKGRILRLKPKSNGCGGFYLCFYTQEGWWHVNRAACWAFHGKPPTPKHEAAHLDGNTFNNKSGNLKWATPIENAAHKKVHGTAAIGSRRQRSFTATAVLVPAWQSAFKGLSRKAVQSSTEAQLWS